MPREFANELRWNINENRFISLFDWVLESPGEKLLDAGAGKGSLSYLAKRNGKKPIACDINPSQFKVKGVRCDKVDLNQKLNYPSNFFDIVGACEVIEHIDNQALFIDEVYRIIKPGGHFIFSTPNIHNWYCKLYFLLKNQFPGFTDGDYHAPGHIHPLIFNIFKNHIQGKFVITRLKFVRSFVPLLHIPLPWRNRFFGETMVVDLRKI